MVVVRLRQGAEVVGPYSSDVRVHRWHHLAITTISSAAAIQEGGVTAASCTVVLVLVTLIPPLNCEP
jgi:hypothetical protein